MNPLFSTSKAAVMTISLSGFMGSGKSSVGKELQKLLSCPLTDLDEAIEQREGKSVPEIFADCGEEYFRKTELSVLEGIFRSEAEENPEADGAQVRILSLGGGTLMTPECAAIIKEHTLNFYLKASIDTLAENLKDISGNRPLLKGKDLRGRIEELMAERESVYEAAADHTIATDGLGYGEIASKIMEISGLG